MKKKRLITAALPYVNNIPHLGNLIQVISADVFARFSRQRGVETLYICGADEYGTATETKALAEGLPPKELCDRFYQIHCDIYQWFGISFDRFGRTSTAEQSDIVQQIYRAVLAGGYLFKREEQQMYCGRCRGFLADRYIRGNCPHCHGVNARGDQCEDCGKLLEPADLLEVRCGTCGETPSRKSTEHLYLDLPKIRPALEEWMKEASREGNWSHNAVQMTESWIREGLKERSITRDLSWGVPVPDLPGKVFYVWFDAPIGYISITACHTEQWRQWWQNPDEVELIQFIGKDNIPFHTVLFPCSLLAVEKNSGVRWTKLNRLSSSEYLNYEGGKFSKTRGTGIFGDDCRKTGIPADCWRFYLCYNRPEKSDYQFTWKDLQQLLNGELVGNLGNFVNRTLTFVQRFFQGCLAPEEAVRKHPEAAAFLAGIARSRPKIGGLLEQAQIKSALHEIVALSDRGNKTFQDRAPWELVKRDREVAQIWLSALVYLIYDLSIYLWAYMPETACKINRFLGLDQKDESFAWDRLGCYGNVPISGLAVPEILFQSLDQKVVDVLRGQFGGTGKSGPDQLGSGAETSSPEPKGSGKSKRKLVSIEDFADRVDLRVARIVEISLHPDAERLFVEKLDVGEEELRTVVSGLVGHYQREDLLGRKVVLVSNLKPAKIRGVKSCGMLLTACCPGDGEQLEVVEVLHPEGEPGTRIQVSGLDRVPEGRISIEEFSAVSLVLREGQAGIKGPLSRAGGAEEEYRLLGTLQENHFSALQSRKLREGFLC